jgi:hypothetical protein
VVDALGRLDLDVLVGCEQIGQLALPVGEQARVGVEDPPCGVEGVVFAAAVSAGVLLHPSAVWSSASPANRTTWEGSITATAFGSSSVAAVLNPVKPVHHDDLHARAPHSLLLGEPGLARLLGAVFDHVQQPCWCPRGYWSGR